MSYYIENSSNRNTTSIGGKLKKHFKKKVSLVYYRLEIPGIHNFFQFIHMKGVLDFKTSTEDIEHYKFWVYLQIYLRNNEIFFVRKSLIWRCQSPSGICFSFDIHSCSLFHWSSLNFKVKNHLNIFTFHLFLNCVNNKLMDRIMSIQFWQIM